MNIKVKQNYQMKTDRSNIRAIIKMLNGKESKNVFHITQKQNAVYYA